MSFLPKKMTWSGGGPVSLYCTPSGSSSVVLLVLAILCSPCLVLSQAHGHNPFAAAPPAHRRPPPYRQRYPNVNHRGAYANAPPRPGYGAVGSMPAPRAGAGHGPMGAPSHYESIAELDKPTFLRSSRKINIKPIRTQWQPNFLQPLPAEKLIAVALYPDVGQNFSLPVKLDGNMAITVHPRRGFTTFNVTYLDVELTVHPYFNSEIRQRMPLKPGEQPVQAMPAGHHAHSRVKRCCVTGAVRSSSGLDIPNLDAGLGMSLGPGSLSYFKEDVAGGTYNLTTLNRGVGMAEIVVFTTLDPEFSPYPRIHGNDPQIKVREITASSVLMAWEAPPEQPDVSYCFIYHRAQDHWPDDVHSSSFAAWMERDTAVHLKCVKSGVNGLHNTLKITGLQPGTEYHIDMLAHNLKTQRETTFIGAQVRTAAGPSGGAHGTPNAHYTGPVNLGRPPLYADRTTTLYNGQGRHGIPGGFRDLPPNFVDNPRRHVMNPDPRGRLPKTPVHGNGQFYNPANPYGFTAIPPTAPVVKVYTPKQTNTRKPWYYNLVKVAGQVTAPVKKYYAPRQWTHPDPRPRPHRDVHAHEWSTAAKPVSSLVTLLSGIAVCTAISYLSLGWFSS